MNRFEILLRPRSRRAVLVWLVAAVFCATSAWLGWDAYERHQALETFQRELVRLRALHRVPPPPKLSREDRERAKRWASLKGEREFRWYPVFRGLEGASNEDIELLEFAPDKVNRTFLLRGEARDLAALLRYLDALASQDGFDNVYLAHQKLSKRDAIMAVAFEIRGKVLP